MPLAYMIEPFVMRVGYKVGLDVSVGIDVVGLDVVGIDVVGIDVVGIDVVGIDVVGVDVNAVGLADGVTLL